MDKRPEDIRRDQLDRNRRDSDTLAGEPGFDPATDSFRPEAVNPDALREETEVDEVEVTRMQIERTRANMSETTDAIQDRLSPENMKAQAKGKVRDATVGKAEGAWFAMVDTVKQNPMPAVLTGIGLTWLFTSGRKQDSSRARHQERPYGAYGYYPPPYDEPSHYEERGTSGSSAGEAMGRAQDKAGETAGRARDKVEDTAGQAQDKAGQIAHRTQDQASRLQDQARHQAQRARGGLERMSRENPLAVGALAVGVGAALGLAIPETGKENEVMGEARDSFVEKTQEKAQEAQQKAQHVAQEAQSAAQQEAGNQGLTNQ